MDKLGRQYIIQIQTGADEVLTIELPFTIEFDISRNFLGGGANHATFRLYNLSTNHRNQIRFNINNYNEFRSVTMLAGYGGNYSLIFKGNIQEAYSVREGVNFITTVECLDGGFAYANSNVSFTSPSGTTQQQLFSQIIGALPNTSLGAVGSFPYMSAERDTPISGSGVDTIKELAGENKFFIDHGKAHVLNKNEYIEGPILVITPQNGLLNTPLLEYTLIHFDMIFEPKLNVGYLIRIQSVTDPFFNNQLWRINAVKHQGMISETVCGEVITSIDLDYGTQVYVPVKAATS